MRMPAEMITSWYLAAAMQRRQTGLIRNIWPAELTVKVLQYEPGWCILYIADSCYIQKLTDKLRLLTCGDKNTSLSLILVPAQQGRLIGYREILDRPYRTFCRSFCKVLRYTDPSSRAKGTRYGLSTGALFIFI